MKTEKHKKRGLRFATSFTMRFDAFTLGMLDRIAYDEDKTRPEAIRSAVKFLFIKKYGQDELENLRGKQRVEIQKKKSL